MDWQMPDLSGEETIQLIQHDPLINQQPTFVLLSSHRQMERQDVNLDIEVGAVITKPVLPSTMCRVLKSPASAVESVPSNESQAINVNSYEAQLRGARILLAEDNELNQELMEEVLTDLGMQVTIVDNGWEAIEALENSTAPFDGVLMDGQMPVMDGYTSTQAIRKQPRFKDLPIIALTANAMDQDRITSLESGMNDHVSKPVDVDTLVETMARWIKPQRKQLGAADADLAGILTASEMTAKLASIEGIKLESALVNHAGKVDVYWRTLAKFVEKYEDFESKFAEALEGGAAEQARQIAHSLKGAAANLGIFDVAEAAQQLELVIKESKGLIELEACLDRVVEALDQVLPSIASVQSGTGVVT
jgi:CheY-like chemotaxis protein/HPt (histidine-containing phosphotransfer) domain-containing protein